LRKRALRAHAENLVREYQIKVGDLSEPVRGLSGGNQQKLVVSRVLAGSPDLLVANNPTRGLDVRATAYVQQRLLEAAQNGAAVVLFTTDLDELAAMSSRALFMSRGELREGGAEAMVG
jgi:simple sugar transport system ATP-binding protein